MVLNKIDSDTPGEIKRATLANGSGIGGSFSGCGANLPWRLHAAPFRAAILSCVGPTINIKVLNDKAPFGLSTSPHTIRASLKSSPPKPPHPNRTAGPESFFS